MPHRVIARRGLKKIYSYSEDQAEKLTLIRVLVIALNSLRSCPLFCYVGRINTAFNLIFGHIFRCTLCYTLSVVY